MTGTDIKILDETDSSTYSNKLGKKIDDGYTVLGVGVSNYSLTDANKRPIETHWWAILSK
jgi:hypothetical protein